MARAWLALVWGITCAAGCSRGAPDRAGLEGTGVAACDAYLTQTLACAAKLPAATRAINEAAIRTARDAFEQRAKAEGGAAQLAIACKQMAEALADRAICN